MTPDIIKFHIKLGFPLFEAPWRSSDQWAQVLGLVAPQVNAKRKLAVPTEQSFADKIADPSSVGYQEIISGITTTRKGKTQAMVYNAQRQKLRTAFTNWSQKLDFMFATVDGVEAKRFKEAVAAAKNLWGAGASKSLLRATGTRLEGIGASIIAAYWLTKHKKAVGSIRTGTDQVVSGSPFNICQPGLANTLVSALTQNLTFALIVAQQAELDPAILAVLNARLNMVAQMFIDPSLGLVSFSPGGGSHLDIINDSVLGEMVSVKVSQV
ncbi:MAG: hypothetical protein HY811_06020 [Planctomycetes bacterium]|nr:hypothetical protein [Planctomycetota bacterium]